MSIFTEIQETEWNEVIQNLNKGSIFMQTVWEQAVSNVLPFVSYRHYRYGDSHFVRVADINNRLTTAPFSEGSDVVSIDKTPLDLVKFQEDIQSQFGKTVRLRINERFVSVSGDEESKVEAYEYVIDLTEPLLPRVRKTLRHVLSHPIEGTIQRTKKESDIYTAYQIYLRHMRRVKNFAMPKSLFMSLVREHGGELWTWSRGTMPEAIAVFIPSSTEVLYSLSAANATAFAAHAPHHLVYTALEAYRTAGITRASLGATGKGSALEVFKRGWRGRQSEIYELGERSMGVGRTSWTREMVRYVPLLLYPLLTPKVGKYLL